MFLHSSSAAVKFNLEFKAVVVLARQAYSHCAEVGKSKSRPVLARSRPRKESSSTALLAGQP